jgi:hypothetical protein
MTPDQIHAFIDVRVKKMLQELGDAMGREPGEEVPRYVMFGSSRLIERGVFLGAMYGCPKSAVEGGALATIDSVYKDAKKCRHCGELVVGSHPNHK